MPVIPQPFPTPSDTLPLSGGLQFKDAAQMICEVVDNGVGPDDPRVMVRLNEATKIIMDYMIPVGGMATANVAAQGTVIILPPSMENAIECHPVDPTTKVRGDTDNTQGRYEITNNSTYLDPGQFYDNPLVDLGLNANSSDRSDVRRVYYYPGLQPDNAVLTVTGKKRYQPLKTNEDYLIVQNIEAIKLVILSIERNLNAAPDEAPKYRQQAFEMLEKEVKNHILDPSNYMLRKAGYHDDLSSFPPDTLGWFRANVALDSDMAMKVGKYDLTWSINQAERRIMQKAIYKGCIVEVQADVSGGIVYFPLFVESVLAVDLEGHPIPVRSQFFEHLENGPGMFSCHEFLKDEGDQYFPSTRTTRRRYKLLANCDTTKCLNAVCKVRWIEKKPSDLMVIKNYEAIRLMTVAKLMEEKEDWKNAQTNQMQAFQLLDDELKGYLSGVRHTVHIQTVGFGLGDVGNYWTR